MKKKRLLIFKCIALILFLASLTLISNAVARYISTVSSFDEARVSVWGVSIDLDSNDIFQKQYVNSESTIIVESDSFVVAPGTSGSASITISGISEVSSTFVLNFEAESEVFLKSGTYLDYVSDEKDKQNDMFLLANDYYPIVFTLTVQIKDGPVQEVKQGKLSEIANALNDYQATYYSTKIFNPGEDIKTKFVLSWVWAPNLNNQADTWLGTTYAKGVSETGLIVNTDYSHEVKYNFSLKVIQVG